MADEAEDNVTQIYGIPARRVPKRFAEFVEEYGMPEDAILVMRQGDTFSATAFTGPDARLSEVLGLLDLARFKIYKDWHDEDMGAP